MTLAALNNAIDRFVGGDRRAEKGTPTGAPGLFVFETRTTTPIECTLWQPIVCLTLQGSKEMRLGDKVLRFRPGGSVIVSHDLPVSSCVTDASPEKPYRSLVLLLDIALLRSLHDQLGDAALDEMQADTVAIDDADAAFVVALARYFALANNPIEAQVLAPLIQKELHFRLLTARHGGMLRRLLNLDSHASRIGQAISLIRKRFRQPIPVAELAKAAGMSASSFHAHFRSITETTPLQYQKDLRLIEARRLLSEQGLSVSAAAFDVGYESPTHFSREYSRKFGVAPSAHAQS